MSVTRVSRLPLLLLVMIVASRDAFSGPPNIIFILADDPGYTDVACFGSRYYKTPNIERQT